MLFQDYKFSQKLFSNKKVLEVGCNQGMTTLQISKFSKSVIAIDNNKNHLSIAKKKRKKKNIKYIKINFFDKKKMLRLGKFEVIYLREIFNFLKIEEKKKIVKILKKNLKQNGKIIVTDFYASVFLRKKFLNFFKLKIVNLFQIDKKSRLYHFRDKNELEKFFNKFNMNISIFQKDPLKEHIDLLSKIIENIYPCKFTVILSLK